MLQSACSRAGSEHADAVPAYVGALEGTVPFADGEGIAYRIQLGEDGRFVSTSVYLGRSAEPFRMEGEYRLDSLLSDRTLSYRLEDQGSEWLRFQAAV